MKRKNTLRIVSIGICFLFVMLTIPSSVGINQTQTRSTDHQTELTTQFLGGIRGGILPTAGFMINNIGDEDAINIQATFNIQGETNEEITYTDTFEESLLKAGWSIVRSKMFPVFGIGPITITLEINADNAESIQKNANGFQLGFRSYIFG